nr:MAG TPA: hypothetical protein [Caudoviricetes sp.]
MRRDHSAVRTHRQHPLSYFVSHPAPRRDDVARGNGEPRKRASSI